MGTDAAMTFRPLTRDDFGQLARWLAQPHVARWWAHEYSAEAIERDFAPMVDGDDPSELWVVLVGGEPVGLLQYCRFADEPEYVTEMESIYSVGPEIVSIDYFIADPALVGRGLGSRMIDEFVRRVFAADSKTAAFVVPVHAENAASGRALEKAGFREVARGEMEPDNPADTPHHVVWRRDR